MDTKEILKNQLSILPSNILSFVQNESWIEDVADIAKKFQLTEENSASLENEVFLVLICMEPEQDFKENIKNELGLDQNIADWITEDIDKNIFSKIKKDIESFTSVEKTKQNNIGNSFEQIIRNQTSAMMPAVESLGQVPQNLPTKEDKVIHNYINKPDPYREPIN